MIRVLGPISTDGGNGCHRSLSRVQRHLLAVLVAAGPSGLALDALADELWGDTLPASWSASLRNHLSRLRLVLDGPMLPTRGGVCRLDLPTHAVDAWLLLTPRLPDEWTDDLVWLLEPCRPYEDVEPTNRIAQSTNRIVAARRRILAAFVTEAGAPVSPALRDVMRACALGDPFDEHLTTLSATADAEAGEESRAFATLQTTIAVVRSELGDGACDALVRFADELGARRQPPDMFEHTSDLERRFPVHLDALLRASLAHHPTQHRSALAGLQAMPMPRLLSIEGDWGAGKSRFLAGIGRSLFDEGAAVRFARGNPSSVAYEAALTALPELRPALQDLLAPAPPSGIGRSTRLVEPIEKTVVWSRAASIVESLTAERPLAVVVDDIDQIDRPSAELLAFLLRGHDDSDLTVVTASRRCQLPDPLATTTRRAHVELEALDANGIADAIAQLFPDLPTTDAARLAESVARLTAGLPKLVDIVLDATDRTTFEPPSDLRPLDGSLDSLLSGIGDADRAIGTALTILCRGVAGTARLGEIARVADRSVDDTLASLDRLVEHRLVHEGPRPDEFRPRHSPAVQALLAGSTRSELRAMHHRCVTLASNSHQRAHHLVAALPLSDSAAAAAALEASASDYVQQGDVRSGLAALRSAASLSEGGLDAVARGQLALCLNRLGHIEEAAAERTVGFRQAAAAGDWELAFAIASSGQHDDLDRVPHRQRLELLETIPLDELSRRSQGLALSLMAILSSDNGDDERRVRYLEQAGAVIDDLDRHELARAVYLSSAFDHPARRLATIDAIVGAHDQPGHSALTSAQAMTIAQLRMIELYRLGHTADAIAELDRFERLAGELGAVRSEWHAGLVRSMLALTSGDREGAEQLSAAAHRLAHRYALAGADEARLAQQFFVHWLDGTHGSVLPLLEQVPATNQIVPVQAAIANALLAVGRIDEAIERARPLVTQIAERNNTTDPTIAAALVDIAAAADEMGDPSLATITADVLAPLSGTIVTLATGILDRGPVDASLAVLHPADSAERSRLLDTAADLAQRSGSAVWQKRIVDLR
ncbi:MAG: AAA family ATPase [Acidimicrobiales bacterium]